MLTAEIILSDGTRSTIECQEGRSLMLAARVADIPGIDADCGGSMVCGTCHVYVAEHWLELLPEPSEMESVILECVPEPRPGARLSCQIVMTPIIDGIEVSIPSEQR